mgnify:CR=1 FL=1
MRTKQILKDLKAALKQDYLYDAEELKFMREQLVILENEVKRTNRKKPSGFGK